MTPQQVKQQIKSTALNKIIKIYDRPYDGLDRFSDQSSAEQRDSKVETVLYEMNVELDKLHASKTTSS